MYLTRHHTSHGARWALDGHLLPPATTLPLLLGVAAGDLPAATEALRSDETTDAPLLPPIEHDMEMWAAGVTYKRSREARMAESETADIYDKVYDADRVEVFFKGNGWRARGHGQPVRVRADSGWDVPEPELALVINAGGDIVGYTVGNDVSSRSIEGENPLYLPQAKVYDGSAGLGPGIMLAGPEQMRALPITMTITRDGAEVFSGETSTAELKRGLEEMAGWLTAEMAFPQGVILMTGTCLVPEDSFTLKPGDAVSISVGNLQLDNPVAA